MVSRKEEQLGILAKRLRSAGVGRRDFLKIAAAAAAGTVTTAGMERYVGPGASAAPRSRFYAMQDSDPNTTLYQFGRQDDPTSFDFNLNLYCNAEPAVFSGLLTFDPDLNAIPDWASEFTTNGRQQAFRCLVHYCHRAVTPGSMSLSRFPRAHRASRRWHARCSC